MHCIQFCISVCFPSKIQNDSPDFFLHWNMRRLVGLGGCCYSQLEFVVTGTVSPMTSTAKGGPNSQFLRTKGCQNCACSGYCTPRVHQTTKPVNSMGFLLGKKKQECCLQHKSPLLPFACSWSNFHYGIIFSVDFPLRISFTAWEALPRCQVPLPLT